MKKHIILLGALTISSIAYSQVGINTETPKATLDVVASPDKATLVDGFIAPRLKGNELKAKDALYTADQTGTIIYATEAAAPTTAKTVNVTEAGYYYFDGTVWVKMGAGAGEGIEPWNDIATGDPATLNTQDIYQMGAVSIGANTIANPVGDKLNVTGNAAIFGNGRIVQTNPNSSANTLWLGDLSTNVGYGPKLTFRMKMADTAPDATTAEMGGIVTRLVNNQSATRSSKMDFYTYNADSQIGGVGSKAMFRSGLMINSVGNVAMFKVGSQDVPDAEATNKLHVKDLANDPVRIEGLKAGATGDKVVVVDATGVLKTMSADGSTGSVAPEPWRVENTTNPATANNQNIYQNGNVGLGNFAASKPIARLDVRGAIRGGVPSPDEVADPTTVGARSIAVGQNNKVSGSNSSSFGAGNTVSGNYSTALGDGNTVTSVRTLVAGSKNTSTGNHNTIVVGSLNTVTDGSNAMAVFGNNNNVGGTSSAVLVSGTTNTVNNAMGAIIAGIRNTVSGNAAVSFGADNTSSGAQAVTMGTHNTASAPTAFAVGNMNEATAVRAVAMGTQSKATANYAVAIGALNEASGLYAHAYGTTNVASGDYSFAAVSSSTASGLRSVAIGDDTESSGHASLATGLRTEASGKGSTAMGYQTVATSLGEVVLGMNNEFTSGGSADTFVATDRILQVGIGAGETNRKNALTIYKNGKVQVNQLKGTGNAYACLDPDGNLFRSDVPCN